MREMRSTKPVLYQGRLKAWPKRPFVDSAPGQLESLATNAASSMHDFAHVLTDQLQQDRGFCRQCHE